ncbi:meiosis-specific apc c activator ama1 protein [Rutstroemia sp. NJR-2017a BVV2]|nr:meiosis-specific apc c activator ama1 protein [Rutstroemia sp. NJR-2017a BVV2]
MLTERSVKLSIRLKHILDRFPDEPKQATPSLNPPRLDGTCENPHPPFSQPKKSVHQRPSLPRSRTSLSSQESTPTKKCTGSLRSPDRFLPFLRDSQQSTQTFRANKDPDTLSTYEKLIRNSSASLDAFQPRRRVTTPIPLAVRPDTRRNLTGNRGRVKLIEQNAYTVSVGTVWAVGGVAPASAGISNGRGGLMGSGTNAPLYTTSFSASRPKAQDDSEKHEDRLAQALEIDRIQRVFEFRHPAVSPPASPTNGKGKKQKLHPKTQWNGTEWVLGGPEHILDAPNLRDDFYCSVLAYSATSHTLAVGLGSLLYAWSEMAGVHLLHGGGMMVKTEDLIVGDEQGNVYYYAVEWPDVWEVTRDGWSGSMTLLARISIHSQQICGLSFSTDGALFATGGNDNLCCLFRTNEVTRPSRDPGPTTEEVFLGTAGIRRIHSVAGQNHVKEIISGSEKHRWVHGAAVKAIAFCPWRDGLIATGGGSNDKCIHFFHTSSGACLATISVAAQVTSLIWSTTRREIAATFGYAQPEHPYRIAVFSWPECKQVAAVPWEGEHRALFAIPYPGGPNEGGRGREGGRALSRTAQEGCIVVASSDESVKFHEVWTSAVKATSGTGEGLLGGSDILEGLEGIDKEGEVIR